MNQDDLKAKGFTQNADGSWSKRPRVAVPIRTMETDRPEQAEARSPLNTDRSADYMSGIANVIFRGVHLGDPMPKERPRIGKGRAFTPKATKQHQRELASCVVLPPGFQRIKSHTFGLRVAFYIQTYQRKDVDNLIKTVMDAFTGLIFVDDSQVREVMGWKSVDVANPRTEFVIYRLDDEIRDSGKCAHCGNTYAVFPSWKMRRFCSRRCWFISLRNAKEIPCFHCSKPIVRVPSQIKEKNFCSAKCRSLSTRDQFVCPACSKEFAKPRSWLKKSQRRVFCSAECYNKAQIGQRMNLPREVLSERSKRAWQTRIASKTNSLE